jgi:hypothetical protein
MAPASTGVQGYVDQMNAAGHPSRVVGAVVVTPVEAVGGAHHGKTIEVGVNTNELTNWPATPPHWIHLPSQIGFPRTNANSQETLPGYLRHSRQPHNWGEEPDPIRAIIAHLRFVLHEATA